MENRRLFSAQVLQTLLSVGGTTGVLTPSGSLAVDANGTIFGETQRGGEFGAGTLFALQRGSTTPTVLATFNGKNGNDPLGGLVMDSAGDLFGATVYSGLGGSGNLAPNAVNPGIGFGTVFEYVRGSGTITPLATFNGPNGQTPEGALGIDANGNLFGTTFRGGVAGFGTVYEIDAATHTVTTLASFSGANGAHPIAGITIDSNGNLFGTTRDGGPAGAGTAFEIAAGSATLTTLATFNRTNGAAPASPLAIDASGNLFGTTTAGGARGLGTVFEIPAGTTINTLASFRGFDGSDPIGSIVVDSTGNVFGTAHARGTAGNGTVFEVAQGSGAITIVGAFSGANGSQPQGLVSDANGILFGSTRGGGLNVFGTLFRVVSSTPGNPGIINATITGTTLSDTVIRGTLLPENTTVSVAVVDQSNESGPVTVTLYASPSGALDSSAVPITYGLVGASITANVPVGADIRVISLPPNLPAGTYTLLAQVTDPTGNTGVATGGPIIQVAAPSVSLQPTLQRTTLPAAVLSDQKTSAVASLRITNAGNSRSVGAIGIALYFSPTGQVSDGTLIATAGTSQIIEPGGAISLNFPLKMIPTGLSGNFSLVALVTDPLGGSNATASAATFAITPATVTLSATLDSFRPTSIPLNRETRGTLTLELTNDGNISVGGPLEIGLSFVNQDGTGSFLLDTIRLPAVIGAGQTRRLTLRFLTQSLPPQFAGTYLPSILVTAPGTPFTASATGTIPIVVG